MEGGYLDTYLTMKNGPDTASDNWLTAEPTRGRCGRAKWTPLLQTYCWKGFVRMGRGVVQLSMPAPVDINKTGM